MRTAVILLFAAALALAPGLLPGPTLIPGILPASALAYGPPPSGLTTPPGPTMPSGLTIPPAPTSLHAEAGSGAIRLTWDPPPVTPPGSTPIVSYSVYRWTGSAEPPPGLAPAARLEAWAIEWVDHGVISGVTYHYRLHAHREEKREEIVSETASATPSLQPLRIVLTIGSHRAAVNGREVELDTPALLIGGRTMVPLRFVAESLGASVDYRASDREVTLELGELRVRLWIGRTTAFIGERELAVDTPPIIRDSRTLVPARFILEAFGAGVKYDPAHARVEVLLANPDGTMDTANPLAPETEYRAALSGSNDIDYYWFTAKAGFVYRIQARAGAADGTAVGGGAAIGGAAGGGAAVRGAAGGGAAGGGAAGGGAAGGGPFAGGPSGLVIALLDAVTGAAVTTHTGGAAWELFRPASGAELRVVAAPGESRIHFRVQPAGFGDPAAAGPYTVIVEARPSRPGDSPMAPLLLDVGTARPAELAAPSDIHYYSFAPEAGRHYRITAADLWTTLPDGRRSEGVAILSLLRSDGETIIVSDAAGGDSGAAVIFRPDPVSAPPYLTVRTHLGQTCSYTILVEEIQPGEAVPGSPAGPRKTEAHEVAADRDGPAGILSSPWDEHWYKFQTSPGRRYFIQTFDLGPTTDTVLTLYGPGGHSALLSGDDWPGMGSLGAGSLIEWTASESGWAYVSVTPRQAPGWAGLGRYRFAVTTVRPENDDHPGFAHPVTAGDPPVDGALVDGDLDWFSLEVSAGQTYIIETLSLSPGCDTVLWLLDARGAVMDASDDLDPGHGSGPAGYASLIRWTADYSGRAYLVVAPYALGEAHRGVGLYALKVRAASGGP